MPFRLYILFLIISVLLSINGTKRTRPVVPLNKKIYSFNSTVSKNLCQGRHFTTKNLYNIEQKMHELVNGPENKYELILGFLPKFGNKKEGFSLYFLTICLTTRLMENRRITNKWKFFFKFEKNYTENWIKVLNSLLELVTLNHFKDYFNLAGDEYDDILKKLFNSSMEIAKNYATSRLNLIEKDPIQYTQKRRGLTRSLSNFNGDQLLNSINQLPVNDEYFFYTLFSHDFILYFYNNNDVTDFDRIVPFLGQNNLGERLLITMLRSKNIDRINNGLLDDNFSNILYFPLLKGALRNLIEHRSRKRIFRIPSNNIIL